MKKGRNKQLTLFLEASGLLSANKAEQEAAKKLYRKAYMLEWKKTAKRKHEVRIMLTDEEYILLKELADAAGFKPTTYMREFTLSGRQGFIPREEELLRILQKIRIARVAADTPVLTEAEQLLLLYLQK